MFSNDFTQVSLLHVYCVRVINKFFIRNLIKLVSTVLQKIVGTNGLNEITQVNLLVVSIKQISDHIRYQEIDKRFEKKKFFSLAEEL